MAFVVKTPYAGKTTVSADSVKEILHDLPPNARQKLKRTKPGIDDVIKELSTSLPEHGEALGIATTVLANIKANTGNIAALGEVKKEIDKLAEVVDESLAYYENEREADIATVAENVKKTARRKDPTRAAAFEATLKYHSQIADKGVATRRKKNVPTTK